MRNYKSLVRQVIFFGVVGIITLGIDLAVTSGLYNVFHFPAYLASAVGFLSGFFFNFPMNRKRVFHHSEKDRFSLHTQAVMYISLSMFNLFATSAIVQLMVSAEVVRIEYAKIFVTILIAIWNFVLFKLVIFSKKPT